MSVRRDSDIESIVGNEGTKIKQFFHPHNTFNGIDYSLAQITLESGKRSLKHKLKASEIYYVLEGQATLQIDKKLFVIKKDDSVYIPPMSEQSIENTGSGKLRLLCIVEPAWKAEDEMVLE